MDQAQRNLSDVMMEIYRNYDFQFLIQMSPYWFGGKSLDDGETGDKRSIPRLVWDPGGSSKIEHKKALASQEMKTESLINNVSTSAFQRG